MIVKPPLGRQFRPGHRASRGLVGCWLMNEGHGGIVADVSGNGNNGVITGAVWTAGASGPALDFEHFGNQYVTVPHSPIFNFSGPFSIVTLVEFESTSPAYYGIVSHDYNAPYAYTLLWSVANELRFLIDGGAGATYSFSPIYGRQYMIAGVWDGTDLNLYVDGVNRAQAAQAAAPTADTTPLHIGLDYRPSTGRSFDGLISYVGLYNRGLTAGEIAHLCREPFCMFEVDL